MVKGDITNQTGVGEALTKKSILVLSTTAMVPGGAMGGALGGMVRQNCTFQFSWAAWSGNWRENDGPVSLQMENIGQKFRKFWKEVSYVILWNMITI